jgi:hypothetical protein
MFSNIKSEKSLRKKEILEISNEEANNICFECGKIKYINK